LCTVTYIPLSEKEFFLTSNRDEAPERAAKEVSQRRLNGQNVTFPVDRPVGGTWIAASDSRRVVCVLNGAFEGHRRTPPYRRSRGLMALDYFFMDAPSAFFNTYTFYNMEPFTFLIFDKGELWEVRYDGERLHTSLKDPLKPHIWSSSTLYDKPVRKKREQWFANWLGAASVIDQQSILELHRNGGEGDPNNDYVMNRNNLVRTVSITSVHYAQEEPRMLFQDLLVEKQPKGSFS
jgi:uncharacterized protein with NRDE domain